MNGIESIRGARPQIPVLAVIAFGLVPSFAWAAVFTPYRDLAVTRVEPLFDSVGQLTIRAEIANRGNVPSQTTVVRLTTDPSAFAAMEQNLGGLAVRESLSVEFHPKAVLPPGKYSAVVTVDPQRAGAESNWNNNYKGASFTVRQQPQSLDLMLVSAGGKGAEGGPLSIRAVVRNKGPGGSGRRFALRISFPGHPEIVQSADVPSPGQSVPIDIPLTFSLPAGAQHFHARLEAKLDTDDANNSFDGTLFVIRPARADLIIASLWERADTSGHVTIRAAIRNQGNAPSEPIGVRLTSKGWQAMTETCPALGPSKTIPIRFDIAGPVKAGTYRYAVGVGEESRGGRVTVPSPLRPDLLIDSASLTQDSQNRPVAHLTVRNVGRVDAPATKVLIRSSNWGEASSTVQPIPAGSKRTVDWPLPSRFSTGAHSVSIVVNEDEAVAESDYKNNAFSVSLDVTEPEPPSHRANPWPLIVAIVAPLAVGAGILANEIRKKRWGSRVHLRLIPGRFESPALNRPLSGPKLQFSFEVLAGKWESALLGNPDIREVED